MKRIPTALTLLGPVLAGCNAHEPEQKLNILYIMSDDHSYQTISAYDQRYIETPNLDRISDDGARFTESFVANSISGPCRACVLTGKHSHMNGFLDNRSGVFDGSQQTFPKLLQKAGYETAIFGKWHLTSMPTGFDRSEILVGQGSYYNPVFIQDGKRHVHEKGYVTDITTDKALDWLENRKDKDKPFCLLVHHKAAHRSWLPDIQDLELYSDKTFPIPETFKDDYAGREAAAAQLMNIGKDMDLRKDLKMDDPDTRHVDPQVASHPVAMYSRFAPDLQKAWDKHYDRVNDEFNALDLTEEGLAEWKFQQYMRDYLRVVHSIDRNVGRILDYLEENDLMDNTVVIYTSDQGFYMGEHGWFDKRFMYEESLRTPLLIHYPGGVKGDISKMVQNIDYAPTFLDIAGAEIPDDIQGESFLPMLQGRKVPGWRKSLFYHYYEYPVPHAVKRHYGIRTERYKLIHFYDDIDSWELFDLKEDPNELDNLYGRPGTERLVRRLKKELIRLETQYQDQQALELTEASMEN